MSEAVVLLVEDNRRINIANRDMLELMGFEIEIAESVAGARERLSERTPDIIVLDIMLPDGSGLDFLRELRLSASSEHIPVIMLTALGAPSDIVKGLDTGADDYLSKPYEYEVLAARIRTVLRRAGQIVKKLKRGSLELDIVASRAAIDGKDLLLKPKEFSLLLLLVQNEGLVMSSDKLYESIWQLPYAGDSQAVRTVASRLRTKLAGTGYVISTRRESGGYCFCQVKN